MRKYLYSFICFSCLIVLSAGCAQTMQFAPQPVENRYNLPGMSVSSVNINVNDLRAERENSETLIQSIKVQLLDAFSTKTNVNQKLYRLSVDVIEHRSYFTFGNWNASTKFRIKLFDSESNIIGNWNAIGNSQRSNMLGYITAKAVSQDSYNIAVADMMSQLSAVTLAE